MRRGGGGVGVGGARDEGCGATGKRVDKGENWEAQLRPQTKDVDGK